MNYKRIIFCFIKDFSENKDKKNFNHELISDKNNNNFKRLQGIDKFFDKVIIKNLNENSKAISYDKFIFYFY